MWLMLISCCGLGVARLSTLRLAEGSTVENGLGGVLHKFSRSNGSMNQ